MENAILGLYEWLLIVAMRCYICYCCLLYIFQFLEDANFCI